MKNLLKNFFTNPPEEASAPQPAVDAHAAQNEIQGLRMEIEARDRRIVELVQEVDRLHDRQERLAAETAAAQFEAFLTDLAGPASQIITQAYLLEDQGKPVQVRDVISVARRIIRAAERHGLSFDNQPGQVILFDPARHTQMSESKPSPGSAVKVRFAGISYQGKILYKTIVE